MTKIAVSAIAASTLILAASIPALAQSTGPVEITQPGPPRVTTPGTSDVPVVKPGGIDNSGPGSVGTEARGALGSESRSNNSGADGNANKPEVAVPNTGGGGGR